MKKKTKQKREENKANAKALLLKSLCTVEGRKVTKNVEEEAEQKSLNVFVMKANKNYQKISKNQLCTCQCMLC